MSKAPKDSLATEDADELTPRERVLKSAREEIREHGILGLRVERVSAQANYSPSVIYRQFGGRDGLIAEVLGDLYEEILDRWTTRINSSIPADGPLTVDDIVRLAPAPSQFRDSEDVRIQLQILAVAATNELLEARISQIAKRIYQSRLVVIEALVNRLPAGQTFDQRVYTVMMVNQMLYYNHLLGEFAVTDEQYYEFLSHVASGLSNNS